MSFTRAYAFKFQRTRFIDPENPDFVLRIDATVSQSHKRSATITQYPVEDGADITDHVHLEPRQLSVSGIISGDPLELYDGITSTALSLIPSNVVRSIGQATASAAEYFTKKGTGRDSREKKAYQYLEELMERKLPFNFVTSLKLYQNMVITSLTVDKSIDSGNSLPFSCEMQEIRIVEGGKFVQGLQDTLNGATGETQDQGKKTATETETDNRSVAAAIYDTFFK